jgi:hypothetical protein
MGRHLADKPRLKVNFNSNIHMMADEIKYNACTKCKHSKPLTDFLSAVGRQLKGCARCRDMQKQKDIRNKCEHNKYKGKCKVCGRPSFCIHDIQKSKCRTCGGSSFCIHNIQKNNCRTCGGSSFCEHNTLRWRCKICCDPHVVKIKQWISGHKNTDKKYNRFDAGRFIDADFLMGLIEKYKNCYYDDCRVDLQYFENNNNLVTLERINNNLGHIKSNCVLCCLKCNRLRKSNTTTI